VSEGELVEIPGLRTRHPDHYVLINTDDGTQWRIRNGTWSQVELEDLVDGERRYDIAEQRFTLDGLRWAARQGIQQGFVTAIELPPDASDDEIRATLERLLESRQHDR
jgi:hypothetical protein